MVLPSKTNQARELVTAGSGSLGLSVWGIGEEPASSLLTWKDGIDTCIVGSVTKAFVSDDSKWLVVVDSEGTLSWWDFPNLLLMGEYASGQKVTNIEMLSSNEVAQRGGSSVGGLRVAIVVEDNISPTQDEVWLCRLKPGRNCLNPESKIAVPKGAVLGKGSDSTSQLYIVGLTHANKQQHALKPKGVDGCGQVLSIMTCSETVPVVQVQLRFVLTRPGNIVV
jgi:hypothetical protein